MKISFVWQGSSDEHTFSHWNDGLREAMRIIEKQHEVTYNEPWDDIEADVIIYWEAPCTVNGENAQHYRKVQRNPARKALLFAGGPIDTATSGLHGFDVIFVESEINKNEFNALGIETITAFGINDKVFRPQKLEKKYDGMMQGTFASWKRHWLVAEALGNKAALCGRKQETDIRPYDESKAHGAVIFPELGYNEVSELVNKSHTVVNTADYWGGGQRCTLEAMACGVPPIVMSDSPKNIEYVQESGFGMIVEPNVQEIQKAVQQLKDNPVDPKIGVSYITSKWTAKHYAQNLLRGIKSLS